MWTFKRRAWQNQNEKWLTDDQKITSICKDRNEGNGRKGMSMAAKQLAGHRSSDIVQQEEDGAHAFESKEESSLDEEGVLTLPDGPKPTLNNKGFQMGCPSPLLEAWISGKAASDLPLLDVGAAYGINTFEAAKRGLKTIAVDMAPEHLEVITKAAERQGVSDLVSVKLGTLPDGLDLAAGSVSSVLAAEVLHFLTGAEIDRALAALHRVLAPGGTLAVTVVSPELLTRPALPSGKPEPLTQAMKVAIQKDRDAGTNDELWPGMINLERHVSLEELKKEMEVEGMPSAAVLPFLHLLEPEDLARAMERAGFRVASAIKGEHPGHPCRFQRPGQSTQIVAIKNSV